MKKFLMMVLAVAFAAAPALAGDFSATGTYWLKGYNVQDDQADVNDQFFMNDFEVITNFVQGPVTATIDWEIVDVNWGAVGGDALDGSDRDRTLGTAPEEELVDNYYLTYKFNDALTFKTGNWGLDWGNKIAIYNVRGYNLAVTYALDMVDLGFVQSTVTEGTNADGDGDADKEEYLLSAAFKKAGPFTKLNFYLVYQNDEIAEESANLIAGEFAVPAGPVALSGEFGMFGGEAGGVDVEGQYLLLAAGLKQLVGFDLNAILFYSSDEMSNLGGENWSPLLVLLNDDLDPIGVDGNNNENLTLFIIKGSYAVNDKLTVGGAILPYAAFTDKDAFGAPKDNIGMELDVTANYKLADNVSYDAGLGYISLEEDNFGPDATALVLYNKLTLKF